MKYIYMDNAGTTQIDPKVLEAMMPFLKDKYGNASSIHRKGREAKQAIEDSRKRIAKLLNCQPGEVYFTGSGTESNNLAIKGTAFANSKGFFSKNKKHIIISSIEHHCVLHAVEWLEKQGYDVTFLPVDKDGLVNPDDVRKNIRKDTLLVSVMMVNNEIGTIEPIKEIGKICKEKGVYFHSDAVQAFGKMPIDVKDLNVDMLTISGHKIYGPKGISAIYIKNGTKIEPILHGGGQERGMRSSTENVAGIVGLTEAAELIGKNMKTETKRLEGMRDKLIKNILKIENSRLNGHPTQRVCNNANFSFKFIEGEALNITLDEMGIAASTGSACSSASLEPSHVLLAIGLSHGEAHGSLRLTVGRFNTDADVDYVIESVPKAVKKLRSISPFKKGW